MDVIHVLLVDDDEDILALLSQALFEAGFSVKAVTSGGLALAELERYTPEMIIADVQMPGMSGYALCRTVRERGLDEIPFFFCSALDTLPQRVAGLRVGADDYIVKPVDPAEIVFRVRKQLKRNLRIRALETLAEVKLSSVLTGDLSEMEAHHVLQLLEQRGQGSFCIHFSRSGKQLGQLHVADRQLVHAQFGTMLGPKAFSRLLALNEGEFQIETKPWTGRSTMSGSITSALIAALTEMDEYRLLRASVDHRGPYLTFGAGEGLAPAMGDSRNRDVLDLIEEHHHLDTVLDRSPQSDAEVMRAVLELAELQIVAFTHSRTEGDGNAPSGRSTTRA